MAGYHRLGALQTFRLGGVDVDGAVVLDVDLRALKWQSRLAAFSASPVPLIGLGPALKHAP